MEEYLDDRDYESLSEFAEQMFATPICNVDHMEECHAETKAMLDVFLAMNEDEIDKEIDRMEELMEAAEEELEERFEILQVQYDEIVTGYEMTEVRYYTQLRFLEEIHELKTVPSEVGEEL
jgi:galactokinase